MTPIKIIIGYVLTFAVFMIVDVIWLGFIAEGLYEDYLGGLLSSEVNWGAAVIFYLLYIAGISVFVIYPAVSKDSVRHALIMGAFFGLVTYGTYDLTNLATISNWPIEITIIDLCWGVTICSIVGVSGYHIVKWLRK